MYTVLHMSIDKNKFNGINDLQNNACQVNILLIRLEIGHAVIILKSKPNNL